VGGASQAVARPARVPVGRDPRDGADHAWGARFRRGGLTTMLVFAGVPAGGASLAFLASGSCRMAAARRGSARDPRLPTAVRLIDVAPSRVWLPGRPVPRVPRCCHRRRHGYLRPNILRSTSRIAATR
jgi:hypothetical protein